MGVQAVPDESRSREASKDGSPLFEAVYRRYFSRLYNYVRYQVRDPHTTDDLVSHVFEKVFLNLKRFDPRKAPLGDWLFAITRNTVRDHARAKKRHLGVSLDAIPERASPGLSPEEAAVRNELLEKLLEAVGGLGAREREIIGLKFAAGLTNRSIARVCGLREGNVAVILYRTVRRLRSELDDGEVSR